MVVDLLTRSRHHQHQRPRFSSDDVAEDRRQVEGAEPRIPEDEAQHDGDAVALQKMLIRYQVAPAGERFIWSRSKRSACLVIIRRPCGDHRRIHGLPHSRVMLPILM